MLIVIVISKTPAVRFAEPERQEDFCLILSLLRLCSECWMPVVNTVVNTIAPAGLREARGFLSNTVTRTDTNASTSTRLVSVSLVRVILVSVSLVCAP